MAFLHYRQLDVFKLAYDCALELHRISLDWPKIEQFKGIADQVRRASKGICANIAEGLNKNASELEQRRFLSIALGSAEEMQLWLSFAKDLGYMDEEVGTFYEEHYDHISRMLAKLMARRAA